MADEDKKEGESKGCGMFPMSRLLLYAYGATQDEEIRRHLKECHLCMAAVARIRLGYIRAQKDVVNPRIREGVSNKLLKSAEVCIAKGQLAEARAYLQAARRQNPENQEVEALLSLLGENNDLPPSKTA